MGTSPLGKTYYLTSGNALLDESLEYKEYFKHLKGRLDDLGYIEADSVNASLKIMFNCKIGEQYVSRTNVQTLQSVTSHTPATYTTTSSLGSLSFSTTSPTTKTTLVPTTSNLETIKLPIFVEICAFDNNTKSQIWKVTIWDEVQRETQIPSVIPFLIVCAENYIGTNSQGEQRVTIERSDAEDKYGLIWPY
uniref:hypothetical protein n=1 Tax=Alistipes sp. TaxID=1872444 RepID=UPI004055AB07